MCHAGIIRTVHAAPRRRPGFSRRAVVGAATTGAAALALGRGATASAASSRQVEVVSFGTVVDLSHPLSPDFPVYPGYQPFSATVTATLDDPGTRSRVVSMEEHVGTHIDAPAHFVADGATVDGIAPRRLVAPLAVINVSARVDADPDATVTVDDLRAWEEEYGELPVGAFVAMRSGWDDRAGDPVAYLNADRAGTLHFPAWSPEAAAFLVDERDIVGLGVDTISLDNPLSPRFEAHRALLGAGGYAVENLARLGDVPAAGATVVVGAAAYAGGSGGQARVLALAP